MTWFTAASVSVNNGQSIVSINTTADDIGIVQEESMIFINGIGPGWVKRGYLDGGSNKKLELYTPWEFGNQVNQPAKVIWTDGGLAKYARILQEVGEDSVTFAQAMAQILSSVDPLLNIETKTSGTVAVKPYGYLVQQVENLLATMGNFGVPLYGTDTKNHARTLLGIHPQTVAQPTIDYDFTNNQYLVYEPLGLTRKTLVEAITCSRNSAGGYHSPFGLGTAAANIPRIMYDPDTGECLGLLSEEGRNNRLVYSRDLSSANWSLSSGTNRTLNYADSPLGPMTATRLQFTGGEHRIFQNFTNNAIGDIDTLSVYVKGTAGDTIRLGSYTAQNFVLNGRWQRIYVTVTATATAGNFSISTFGGATARDILVVAAQLESGSFPTSYNSSEVGATARLTDGYSIIHQHNPYEFTLFGQFRNPRLASTGKRMLAMGTSGTNRVEFNESSLVTQVNNDLIRPIPLGFAFNPAMNYNTAYKFFDGIFKVFVNGMVIGTSAQSANKFFESSAIRPASSPNNAAPADVITQRIRYYPRALSDQELIDLTRL